MADDHPELLPVVFEGEDRVHAGEDDLRPVKAVALFAANTSQGGRKLRSAGGAGAMDRWMGKAPLRAPQNLTPMGKSVGGRRPISPLSAHLALAWLFWLKLL